MSWSSSFEQFSRQLSDFQRAVLTNWSSAISNTQNFSSDHSKNFEKTLKFQEAAVKSSLEFQAQATRIATETQKEFWESYFKLLRKE